MNEIRLLLWKEYRSNLHLIIFGIVVLFLPFVLICGVLFSQDSEHVSEVLAASFLFGSVSGLILSQFTILCLGGHLIGGERANRTFEFLFVQPVTRFRIAISKLTFAFLWTVVTWAIGGLMVLVGYLLAPEGSGANFEIAKPGFFFEVAAVGAMMFSASWFASNKVENSVVAMSIGALATACVFLFMQLVIGNRLEPIFLIDEYDWSRPVVLSVMSWLALVAGVVAFVKRKSP